jgi:adenylate cyclase
LLCRACSGLKIKRSRRKRPENLEAYDLVLRARPHLDTIVLEDAQIAVRFLGDALKLEPSYAVAHAHQAPRHDIFFSHSDSEKSDNITGLRHARFVIASGTDDAMALAIAVFEITFLSRDH